MRLEGSVSGYNRARTRTTAALYYSTHDETEQLYSSTAILNSFPLAEQEGKNSDFKYVKPCNVREIKTVVLWNVN
jgi:hypothetical protein